MYQGGIFFGVAAVAISLAGLARSVQPAFGSQPETAGGTGEPITRLAFFSVEHCPDCERVEELISAYRHDGPGKVKINYYDLDDPTALRLNEMLCRALDVPREQRRIAPALFSADKALVTRRLPRNRWPG